jgi:hypothetical protein
MQSVKMPWRRRLDYLGNPLDPFGLAQQKGLGQRVPLLELVIEKSGWGRKGRNCNDESKDKKMRAHTMPLRCTKRRRVLRRYVSLRRKRRRGDRVSVRPSGVSAHVSAVCASQCR